jgi:hypothetical protein
MQDGFDALSHLGARIADTGGGFEAIRIAGPDGGEILCGPTDDGWVIDHVGPDGGSDMILVNGEHLVETIAGLLR